MPFPFRPEIPDFVELDLSNARRVFVFGDIHGNLKPLKKELKALKFDPDAGDHLIGCGDWLNRGPQVLKILKFIQNTPNLHFVRGNHEEMLQNAVHGCGRTNALHLIKNGGAWIYDFIAEDGDISEAKITGLDPRIVDLCNLLNAAPVAIEVIMPGGKRVGIVHAEVGGRHWQELRANLTTSNLEVREQTAFNSMWRRDRINAIRDRVGRNNIARKAMFTKDDRAFARKVATIEHIDHVFFGHTVIPKVVSFGNSTWVDTGSYSTGKLSVIDIATHID